MHVQLVQKSSNAGDETMKTPQKVEIYKEGNKAHTHLGAADCD